MVFPKKNNFYYLVNALQSICTSIGTVKLKHSTVKTYLVVEADLKSHTKLYLFYLMVLVKSPIGWSFECHSW